MNALGFLSFLLSLLSLAVFASFDQFSSAQKIRTTYIGHVEANRDIFNQMESASYRQISASRSGKKQEGPQDLATEITIKTQSLSSKNEGVEISILTIEKQPVPPKQLSSLQEENSQEESEPASSPFNPESARLNLMPLLNGKKSEEPFLYETTLKLLCFFYGDPLFEGKKKTVQQFFNAWLIAIDQRKEKKDPFPLEKIEFSDPKMQHLYYKMLKGTKEKKPYPSLLEYFKVEFKKSKIFLCKADLPLLEALFSKKAAHKLYAAFHEKGKTPLPYRETVERICLESHLILDPKLLDLCDFTKPHSDQTSKSFFLGQDPTTQMTLQKNLNLSQNTPPQTLDRMYCH
ncbi:MAG: hypothetical protein HY324_01850 [Chlamydiia bacterium]|nr:hypothetical protein [Chlamydiia bacterium]